MTQTVLLVDDDIRILDGLKRVLRREPYEVLTADSAGAAFKVLEQRSIDLIVSDEKMPGMSGTEFLRIVRERHPSTVRIMLTGEANVETAMRAINIGEIFRFFTKPCNEIELGFTIRDALRQKNLISSSLQMVKTLTSFAEEQVQLEKENPGISWVKKDSQGRIVIEESAADLTRVLMEAATELEEELFQAEVHLGTKRKN